MEWMDVRNQKPLIPCVKLAYLLNSNLLVSLHLSSVDSNKMSIQHYILLLIRGTIPYKILSLIINDRLIII